MLDSAKGVLSSLLFVIFTDRISWRSQGIDSMHFGGLEVVSLLYAGDVVLLAPSDCDLQHTLEHFAAEFEAARMRISNQSVTMVLSLKIS